MMTSFKAFPPGSFCFELNHPSVKIYQREKKLTLYLKFNSQDVLTDASYSGKEDPWMDTLCFLIQTKNLPELLNLNFKTWEETFRQDQYFWDLSLDLEGTLFFEPLELLHAGLDLYRGRDYFYQNSSPLICRCFGIREKDVLSYLQSAKDPSFQGLSDETKAAKGCRSCSTQLRRWFDINKSNPQSHYFKDKSRANWLLEIDYLLSCFPLSQDWKMTVKSFKGSDVVIEYSKDVSQKEIEKVGEDLQDFLAAGLDPDLNFFLARA